MKAAPKSVSGRVVKISSVGPGAASPANSKRMRRPSERPIQFRCISRTLSGHRSRPSRARRRSSLYSVMVRNHWVSSRCSTGAPERQPLPSITCSLARTVWSTGSQLTARGLAGDEAGIEEIEEQALLLAIILDIAGGEFARPVEGQAHRFELVAHRRDIPVGPLLGVDAVLHRGVLCRHAEGIPAHRMENVEPPGALVACDHVPHRVVADMAHMDAPGGVGEHLEDVVFRARIGGLGLEQAPFGPDGLPMRLDGARIVAFCGHDFAGSRKTGKAADHQQNCRRRSTRHPICRSTNAYA